MKTGKRYWLRKGFLPAESSAFKNITTEAIKDSRYISVMIETRMRRRREAIQAGLTVREFYQKVRKNYVRRGLSDTAKSLEFDGVKGRRLAFAFFNLYKDKYAVRDNTGKVVETPRKKAKVKKKPITGKSNIDQMIRKDREAIKYLRSRLKFERGDYMKSQYQERIKRHQDRITRLKAQSKR